MKAYIYLAVFAASISFFASCSNNELEDGPVNSARVEKTFGVGTPTSTTRAYIYKFNDDPEMPAQNVFWHDDDQITIFANGHETGDTFDFVEYGEDKSHATFHGMTFDESEFYVLYPAQKSSKLSGDGQIQFTIPAEQTATKGSFDRKAGIQLGHVLSATGEIALKNAVSYISFHAEPGVSWVEMKSKTSDWYLAGTVTADAKSGGDIIKTFPDGSETVTLKGIPAEGGDFLIAFIPSNGLPGFEVTTHSSNGVMHFQFNSNQQFLAGNIYELGTIH